LVDKLRSKSPLRAHHVSAPPVPSAFYKSCYLCNLWFALSSLF
jgi:hypothetical protein